MNELLIFGEIGWENTAKDVVARLAEFDGGDVTVRINSGGGDVYEGLAIMNALRGYPGTITAVVEGLAASAASFIAVGGADRVVCRPNAELMIHEAWTFVDGNAETLQKTLADLDRISGNLAGIYAERTGGDADHWRGLMRAETWFSADEALAVGLVDAVEDARQPVAAAVSAGRSPVSAKVLARFKYSGRGSAPPPPVNETPSDGQEGGAMSFLNELAQELGKDPEAVKNAFTKFMNEQTAEVPAVITVAYPDEVTVVPTGRTKVEPLTEVPEGLTFSVAGTSDGWSAEVNETTGVVTVISADGSRIGDTGEVTLTVTGDRGEAEFVLATTVVSADQQEENTGEPAADPEVPPAPDAPTADQISMDRDTYAELRAAAQFGWKAMQEKKDSDLVAEVDGWIREGRISAGLRSKAIKAIKKDAEVARDLYGANPKNTIPRGEVGYGLDVDVEKSDVPSRDDLLALSKSRMAGEKK